jgi:hypothetical protein
LEDRRSQMANVLWRLAPLVVIASASTACDIQPDVTEGPSPLPPATYATIQIEYRQPNACQNVPESCVNRVVFFGSWMRPGEEILLEGAPGHIWVGQATNVPVNWPPVIEPHLVRVFDPYLVQTPTDGVTASRIRVGGQILTDYNEVGTPKESGLVYVDVDGIGHNPP